MTPHSEQKSPSNTPKREAKRSKASPNTPKRNRAPNERQKAFAMAYLRLRSQGNENGTEAARMAGYKGRPDTLAKTARANLQNPNIQAMIQEMTTNSIEPLRRPASVTKFRYILGVNETLAAATFLATATLDDVLDEDGHFDIKKARETGGIHALTRLKVKTVKRRHKDGSEDRTVTHDLAIEPRSKFIDLMGHYLELWEGIGNPLEVVRRLMKPIDPAPGTEDDHP